MAERKLRNEETKVGKKIWEAVDKAASGAPDWVKGNLAKMERENLVRTSKTTEAGVKGTTPAARSKTK